MKLQPPEPIVCISVPTYNAEATLARTLDSILGQTHRNLLIKIYDNASTDRTIEIANAYSARDPRVQIQPSEVNLGAEGNFTRCLANAAGDFTGIFHSDDIYESSMIAEQVDFLQRHPDCVAVATHASIIDDRDRVRGERFYPFTRSQLGERYEVAINESQFLTLIARYGNFVTCPSVLARSSVYRDGIRIWNGQEFKSSADLDVWWRLVQLGPIGFIARPLMRYRVSSVSFTVRETKQRLMRHDLLHVLDEMRRLRPELQTAEARQFLNFLEFKDIAVRRWNRLRVRAAVPLPRFEGSWKSVLSCAVYSRFHFKFTVAALTLYCLTAIAHFIKFDRAATEVNQSGSRP